jgi:hypothetical protein
MTEIPPYLFIVTSTALVLGVAITIRGLLGFRPLATDAALPNLVLDDTPTDPLVAEAISKPPVAEASAETPVAQATAEPEATLSAPVRSGAPSEPAEPADIVAATEEPVSPDVPPTPVVVSTVRDLREPLIMTIAGILICTFTMLGIAALVNSA